MAPRAPTRTWATTTRPSWPSACASGTPTTIPTSTATRATSSSSAWTAAEPVDVLTDFVGNEAIGLHVHDDAATPGETTLAALPYFSTQPFQSGIDVFLVAAADARGTITVTNIPRGDTEHPQVLNVPNWPSSDHSISVVFTDHPVD